MDSFQRRRCCTYARRVAQLCSDNPNFPTRVGDLVFRFILSPKSENDKYARQVRSSAGIAVFIGHAADKVNWVHVGRCYERFALQATARCIRIALLNQPVEVAALCSSFAAVQGLAGQRPDLVVRFSHGPLLPRSLRRPVESPGVRRTLMGASGGCVTSYRQAEPLSCNYV